MNKTYRIAALFTLKEHQCLSSVMFLTEEFCSVVCTALQFVILFYLIRIYEAVLQLGMNHQQDLTEGRDRSNRARTDTADPHICIRHATEHDERED